jgi:hypothetical protein
MPCPRCGSSKRWFVQPGRWRCTGGWTESGAHISGGYSGGPGLTNPMAGPGIIYHPPSYRPDRFHKCGTEYDVADSELTPEERKHYSHTLAAQAEVDHALPLLTKPQPPVRPGLIDPDPFWFFGLIPWWLGGTFAVWIVLNAAHLRSALALAAEIAGGICLLVFALWMTRAMILRASHNRALRAHEDRIRAAEERVAARIKMLKSFK